MRRLLPLTLLLLALAACAPPGPPEVIDLPTLAVLPTQPPSPTFTPTLTPSVTHTPSATPSPTATPTGTLPPTATVTVTPSATITDTVTPTPSDTVTPTETVPPLEGLAGLAVLAARATVIPDFLTPGTPPVRSRLEVPRRVTARPGAVTATPLFTPDPNALPSQPAPPPPALTPTPLGGSVPSVPQCPTSAPGGFGTAIAANPLMAVTLGCPTGNPPTPEARFSAYQRFQDGFMVWVASPGSNGNIYVFDRNGTVSVYPDTFQDGVDPERGGETPPAGLSEPIRGFGKVWREQPAARETLGWATGDEQGGEATLLTFEQGQMLALPQINRLIAVGNDGTWLETTGRP